MPKIASSPPLLPHAPVTPLSTASTSSVPIGALAALKWYVFDNVTQREAMARYNAAGYGHCSSHHGISWLLRKWGAEWYREQGAVRPWKLYKMDEKMELEGRRLGKKNFEFVHPRDLSERGEKGDEEAGRRHTRPKRNATRKLIPLSHPQAQRSLVICLRLDLPAGHRLSTVPAHPFPTHLKPALLAKHAEWLEANTGRAELVDPLEEELAVLEKEAIEVNKYGFLEWKFGVDGYGN